MIITGLNNTEEITVEEDTFIRIKSEDDCTACAFEKLDSLCQLVDCEIDTIYIKKHNSNE